MKTYEILVKAFTTVVIKAEDEDQAMQWAADNVTHRGMDLDEMSIDRELKSEDEISRAVKCSEYHSHDSQKTPYDASE